MPARLRHERHSRNLSLCVVVALQKVLWHELQFIYVNSPLLTNAPEDSVFSRTGFVQPPDRVCIELKACGANNFVKLRK